MPTGSSARPSAPRSSAGSRRIPSRPPRSRTWQRQNDALDALFGPVAERADPGPARPAAASPTVAAHRSCRLAAASPPRPSCSSRSAASIGWFGRDVVDARRGRERRPHRQRRHRARALRHGEAPRRRGRGDRGGPPRHLALQPHRRRRSTPPDLSAEGFTLVGGRLLPAELEHATPARPRSSCTRTPPPSA